MNLGSSPAATMPPTPRSPRPQRAARPTPRAKPRARAGATSVRAVARQSASEVYRDHILTAAEAEFTGRGYDATRMADIARRAEMSVGALYRHFDSKEAVFAELVAIRGQVFLRSLEAAAVEVTDAAARIGALVRMSLAFIEDNRSMFQVFTQVRDAGMASCEALSGRVGDLEARIGTVYRAALDAGVAAGVLTGEVAVDDQLNFYRGAMHGFIEDWILRGAAGSLTAKAPLITRLFLRALGGSS